MKREPLIVLLAFLALAVSQATATELLQNGSFQTGDFTDWTLGTTPYGTAGVGFPIVGQWPLDNNVKAWEGNVGVTDFCCGQQGATLSQVFTAPGLGVETIKLDYAAVGRPGGWNAEGGFFQLVMDGNILANGLIGGIYPGQTINSSFYTTVALGPGQHTFEIDVERYATSDDETPLQYVTNASIDFEVPEPGSVILMGSGVLGLAGVLRRKIGF